MERTRKKQFRIKIISMGNAESGKSCIIKRYCEKRFVHKYLTTIGIDYGVTKVIVKDKDVKVNIFDMAGHPIFYEVRNEFYKDTQGAILVYDVTDRASFESLESWVMEMRNEIGNQTEAENVVVVVCGNKCDKKPRVVDEAEAHLWADGQGFSYFEMSALTGDGVNEMFNNMFDNVVGTIENGGRKKLSTTLGYTRDQVEAIQRLKNSKDNYERLGLNSNASKDEINKAYRKLSIILHPDKNVAPGSEEAFKLLVAARTSVLQSR